MNPLFSVHKLNTQGLNKAMRIGYVFSNVLDELGQICPAGRDMAIVMTKLQEACFFAKRAMACGHENQEVMEVKQDAAP